MDGNSTIAGTGAVPCAYLLIDQHDGLQKLSPTKREGDGGDFVGRPLGLPRIQHSEFSRDSVCYFPQVLPNMDKALLSVSTD